MAVNESWLEGVRQKNRAKFGMGGLGGLGEGAEDILAVLRQKRAAKEAAEAQAAAEAAAAAAGPNRLPELPPIMLPPVEPIPRELKIAAGLVAAGLFGLIVFSVFAGRGK